MRLEKAAKKSRKAGFLALLTSLLLCAFLEAITITVTGSWSLAIGQANLQGAAGSNLAASYESSTSQLAMTIGGTYGHTWRVDVARVDTTWHASFSLYIKRTNGGTSGRGTVYPGGETYGLITTTAQTFWTGINNRSNIYLQEKLEGVSCAIPARSYSTTVRFTVVQTN